jgi:hypothetical protein
MATARQAWRCPGCGTLQVEAAACFVCNQSATSCATCVNFRRAVVNGLGYCAQDRRHEPLTGAEERPCWTSADAAGAGDGLFDSSLTVVPVAAPPGRGLVEPPVRAGVAP